MIFRGIKLRVGVNSDPEADEALRVFRGGLVVGQESGRLLNEG